MLAVRGKRTVGWTRGRVISLRRFFFGFVSNKYLCWYIPEEKKTQKTKWVNKSNSFGWTSVSEKQRTGWRMKEIWSKWGPRGSQILNFFSSSFKWSVVWLQLCIFIVCLSSARYTPKITYKIWFIFQVFISRKRGRESEGEIKPQRYNNNRQQATHNQ